MKWTDDDLRAAIIDALSNGKVWNGKRVTALEWASFYVSEYGRRNLTAADRKVEDGEVATMVKSLRYLAQDDVADLLTRLSAALKEAERRATRAEKMHAEAFRIGIQHQEAAQSAEAKLETARRDALEEAATVAVTVREGAEESGYRVHSYKAACKAIEHRIRALQTKDTTE